MIKHKWKTFHVGLSKICNSQSCNFPTYLFIFAFCKDNPIPIVQGELPAFVITCSALKLVSLWIDIFEVWCALASDLVALKSFTYALMFIMHSQVKTVTFFSHSVHTVLALALFIFLFLSFGPSPYPPGSGMQDYTHDLLHVVAALGGTQHHECLPCR